MSEVPSRLGPYEILGRLGAGGMGQVYRGRDTRLQRSVAIKILLETARLDPDRQRRFAQEAVAASALNHPNILTVYDVGSEGDHAYLVSELIDGESLRSEMHRGRVALKRVVEIAHQIAEGLAAAHEAGIVHRDLKPENVMITSDGRVKIVDFGLAKAEDDEEDAARLAQPDTQTASGLIIGTVPYMSPEQARGGKADFRSDQFALGVMLYELTTATHPFKRETAVQTLSAIIAEEPPDPSTVNPALPVAMRWLIRRLLAKNPRERFAHTADLAADLRMARAFLNEATTSGAVAVPVPRSHWRTRIALVALATAVAFLVGRGFATPGSTPRFEKFTPFATDAGYQGAPAWSPDGRTIAYEAAINGVVQVFTRTFGSPLRTQVTNSAFDCYDPMWSPDGRQIYYHSLARDKDALWAVSPAGGAPRLVAEGATRSALSPDGRTLAVLREESTASVSLTLWIASPPDAEPLRYERGVFKGATFSSGLLRFSPDGSKLLVWVAADASGTILNGFVEIPMTDGEPRQLLPTFSVMSITAGNFSWLNDNRHIVVVRSDGPTPGTHLWIADTISGALSPLTATAGNEGAPAVSPDGRTIAFASEATDFDLVEVPIDGSPVRPFLSSTRNEFDPAASPVSTQYAFVTDRTGVLEIWLQNEEGYLQQPLVKASDFGAAAAYGLGSLSFSPDGRRLAFQRLDPGEAMGQWRKIWISPVSGGTPVQLGGEEGYQDAPTWSPDGEWIAYVLGKVGEWSLAKSRVGGGAPIKLLSDIPPFVARPQWSPDGRWILCETTDGLALVANDGSTSRLIGGSGWLTYNWAADGRQIYGLRLTDDLHHFMLATVDPLTGAERIINRNLGAVPQANQPIRGFSRLRDGGFLTSIARVRSDIYLIEGFRPFDSWWERVWPFAAGSR